ncbi:MAG: DUF1906 domain-containing protein [Symploca sp. SIO1B1]|nr:DUF1906 domain-containing protein [Symploca sp. SIO1B1]
MTNLEGLVVGSLNKLQGFDTADNVSLETAKKFYQDNYRFCLRYIPNSTYPPGNDLTEEEAKDILLGGLALMVVQHVRGTHWIANGALGQQDGEKAATWCQNQVKLPPKVSVWCDLETMENAKDHALVIDYCREWYHAVYNAGYTPGLYVGAGVKLSSEQLYDLPFQNYWKSVSSVPAVYERGYQMVQNNSPHSANGFQKFGINIDENKTYIDNLLGRSQMLILPEFAEKLAKEHYQ